jgi:hypothetical protein
MNQSSNSSMTSNGAGSYSSRTGDGYTPNRNALAQANATSGAQARRLLDKGAYEMNNDRSDRTSYGYGQNQSQLPTSGVTSGAETINQGDRQNSQLMARCPEGMMPRTQSNQFTPGSTNQDQNQATPDRNNVPRERTAPDTQTNGR